MMNVSGFDWDDGNCNKCLKHGVSIAEIEAMFSGEPFVSPDIGHSGQETRFIAIGKTANGRYLFVTFVFRSVVGAHRIRPISARYMHQKEIDRFDQAIAAPNKRR